MARLSSQKSLRCEIGEDNAASSGMKVVDCPVRDGPEIQAAIGAFDGEPTTGLIVLPDPIGGSPPFIDL